MRALWRYLVRISFALFDENCKTSLLRPFFIYSYIFSIYSLYLFAYSHNQGVIERELSTGYPHIHNLPSFSKLIHNLSTTYPQEAKLAFHTLKMSVCERENANDHLIKNDERYPTDPQQ